MSGFTIGIIVGLLMFVLLVFVKKTVSFQNLELILDEFIVQNVI
jgi:hypothetical protein